MTLTKSKVSHLLGCLQESWGGQDGKHAEIVSPNNTLS